MNLIAGNSDAWLDFAFEMSECSYPLARRVEEEIAASRENSGNGFQGILGELFKGLQCLSDPVLMDSVSPPFTASFADLCSADQRANFYLIVPAEYLQIWSPILKAFFVTARRYKSQAPQAPRQTWIVDEAAQLGAFPLLTELFSIGAGMGVRPVAVYQSSYQMEATGRNARQIITSSAACRLYFGVRDYESAQMISNMLGAQTLEYDDALAQSQAKLAKRQAVDALLSGGDPFEVGRTLAHHSMASTNRTKQHRALRTADEILNDAPDGLYLFTDALPKPAYVIRKPYWTQRFMAGRYLPNPYHPPLDQVTIQTCFGQRARSVVTERVPARYAHLPQYSSGHWSYVAV